MMEQFCQVFQFDCSWGLRNRLHEIVSATGYPSHAPVPPRQQGAGRGKKKGSPSSPDPNLLPPLYPHKAKKESHARRRTPLGPLLQAQRMEDLDIQEPMFSAIWVRQGEVEVKCSGPFSKLFLSAEELSQRLRGEPMIPVCVWGSSCIAAEDLVEYYKTIAHVLYGHAGMADGTLLARCITRAGQSILSLVRVFAGHNLSAMVGGIVLAITPLPCSRYLRRVTTSQPTRPSLRNPLSPPRPLTPPPQQPQLFEDDLWHLLEDKPNGCDNGSTVVVNRAPPLSPSSSATDGLFYERQQLQQQQQQQQQQQHYMDRGVKSGGGGGGVMSSSSLARSSLVWSSSPPRGHPQPPQQQQGGGGGGGGGEEGVNALELAEQDKELLWELFEDLGGGEHPGVPPDPHHPQGAYTVPPPSPAAVPSHPPPSPPSSQFSNFAYPPRLPPPPPPPPPAPPFYPQQQHHHHHSAATLATHPPPPRVATSASALMPGIGDPEEVIRNMPVIYFPTSIKQEKEGRGQGK